MLHDYVGMRQDDGYGKIQTDCAAEPAVMQKQWRYRRYCKRNIFNGQFSFATV